MPLPASLTDKLDAVNVLLQAIGEAPVSDLLVSEDVDVAAAMNALDEHDLAVQSEGWAWNREVDMTIAPNGSGHILLPNNCLAMNKAYWASGGAQPFSAVERGRKLYNRSDHTYQFTQPVHVDMILRLEWDEMPEAMRRYITIRAAKQFQARLQTNATVDRITDTEVVNALATLHQRDDEAEENNAVDNNPQNAHRVHGNVRRRFR